MTDAAACAGLTLGPPVVAITALQELRVLLDAVVAGASAPSGCVNALQGGLPCAERVRRSPLQIPLFPPAESALRIELAAPQRQELIRALAELLLDAVPAASAPGGRA